MSASIARETELFICGKLTNAVTGHSFYPFHGGSLSGDAAEIEPPFTVIMCGDAEKTHQQESTWNIQGTAQIITHPAETTSPAHATLVRQIFAALTDIAPEVPSAAFSFHGIDVRTMRESTDSDEQAHADIIEFTCGVGG